MSDSYEVFEGKSLSDVFKDIYNNSESNKKQIEVLMKDLLKFVTDTASAVALVPILKDYLEVSVKNDEQLIKVAAIVQKLASAEAKGSDNEFGLSELEKEQLMSGLTDTIQEIQEESDRISEEIDSKQSTFPEG
jgi:hypothetical protein|tara:strand:+ start:3006 stop:3407 length:402 start_codon:yes stop_codon:yes gene_type:complete